jgi:MFS superfamily sulfate permease-like transporter
LLCFGILFPVVEWGKGYNLGTLRHDLVSGLTIGSLSIPQVPV